MSKITVTNKHPSFVAGWEGEHRVTQVYFDISGFQKEFGSGTVHLMVRRRGEKASYLVPAEIVGSQACWTMTAADLARPGYGEAQLMYLVGERVAKSEMYHFYVEDALGGSCDEPDPRLPYLEKVAEYADHAIRSAELAERAAAGVHDVTEELAQAKQHAEDARSAAAEARQAAEGVRDVSDQVQQVETLKQNAETARDEAAAAQAGAETARETAGRHAAAAAEAEHAARDFQQAANQAAGQAVAARTAAQAAADQTAVDKSAAAADRQAAETAKTGAEAAARRAEEAAAAGGGEETWKMLFDQELVFGVPATNIEKFDAPLADPYAGKQFREFAVFAKILASNDSKMKRIELDLLGVHFNVYFAAGSGERSSIVRSFSPIFDVPGVAASLRAQISPGFCARGFGPIPPLTNPATGGCAAEYRQKVSGKQQLTCSCYEETKLNGGIYLQILGRGEF